MRSSTNMPETTSSDESALDPRADKLLESYCCPQIMKNELSKIIWEIEREAIFGESCNLEQFLRGLATSAIKRGETASARILGPIADSVKQIREKRFPDLIAKLTKGSH